MKKLLIRKFSNAILSKFSFDENNNLFIYLCSNNENIKIECLEVDYFLYKGGNQVIDFFEIIDSSYLKDKYLRYKELGYSEPSLRLLRIESLDQRLILEATVESFSIASKIKGNVHLI